MTDVLTIVIDDTKCIAAGECLYNHPDHFAWSDDGAVAVVVKPEIVTDGDRVHAEQAVPMCPGGAISIVEV